MTTDTDLTPERRYRPSLKRSSTREAGVAKLTAAAWQVFSTIGFDASTARDIVEGSGLSQGSFYNYGGNREQLFDAILTDLIEQVRVVTAAARSAASTIHETLESSYRALLEFTLRIDGAAQFCELNQHHIRAKMSSSPATVGLLEDLRADIYRLLLRHAMTEAELVLLSRLILATGLEALIAIHQEEKPDFAARAHFMADLLTNGIASHASKT